MKSLLFFSCLSTLALASDVAVFELKFPSEKKLHTVEIELRENDAPATVANFKKLANKGYYKGCTFHRALPGALVQTGDPLSKKEDRTRVGTGGPGYTLPAEVRAKHVFGAVGAARLPDKLNPQRQSNGSQFYICLAPQPTLDGKQTVFGNVVKGIEVLQRISELPADANDYPTDRVEIRRVRIESR